APSNTPTPNGSIHIAIGHHDDASACKRCVVHLLPWAPFRGMNGSVLSRREYVAQLFKPALYRTLNVRLAFQKNDCLSFADTLQDLGQTIQNRAWMVRLNPVRRHPYAFTPIIRLTFF